MRTDPRTKPIVGLAGGIGSGKSTVAAIFGEMGAAVISSDELNRQELASDGVKAVLVNWWGEGIVNGEGAIDRRRISSIVFSNDQERRRLETLLHPRIAARREGLTAQYERDPAFRMIVLDSPLLYETGLDEACDAVVFVETSDELRKGRSEKVRAWPDGELQRREKSQLPLDTKRARADHICVNNSDHADLRRQVGRILAEILESFGDRQ